MGTHYLESAIFGGHRYLRTSIKGEYVKAKSERFLRDNLKATLARNLAIPSNVTVSPDFLANSQLLVKETLGGLSGNLTERDWTHSLSLHPWLLSAHLRPITDLIINGKVKEQVRQAITYKTTRAYLIELKRVIQIGSFNLTPAHQKTLADAAGLLKTRNKQILVTLGKDLVAIWSKIEELRNPGKVITFSQITVWGTWAFLGVVLLLVALLITYLLVVHCRKKPVSRGSAPLQMTTTTFKPGVTLPAK